MSTIVPDLDGSRERVWSCASGYHLVRRRPDAFARLVKRQRTALGLSQKAAGDRCGVSHMAVCSVETMIWTPSRDTAERIMTGLGLTVSDIRAEIAAMNDEVAA